jgi:hypothetical protein
MGRAIVCYMRLKLIMIPFLTLSLFVSVGAANVCATLANRPLSDLVYDSKLSAEYLISAVERSDISWEQKTEYVIYLLSFRTHLMSNSQLSRSDFERLAYEVLRSPSQSLDRVIDDFIREWQREHRRN